MSVPNPPYYSTTDELLYNIYLKIQGGNGVNGLTANDINTLGKVNAILQDADLMSSEQVNASLAVLKGDVPDVANTLGKLYNIIQGITYLKQEDIDTIAELNAIITDADLVRISDLADALVALNLKRRTIQFFLEPNFHERNVTVLKGKIYSLSEDFSTGELVSVSYRSRLDLSTVWVDHDNLGSLQNWINQVVTGTEADGVKFWIRCIGNYKQGHNGDAVNLFTYSVS
jgi:hypothetical protein